MKKSLVALVLVFIMAQNISAQSDDLNIFGYYQINYTNFDVYTGDTKTMEVNSFLMQQMNLFFQKNFTSEFSSFVNLEFTNSFSLRDSIGGLKIEEAWLKYSPSTAFNLKAGVLIPRFNNFNEIKNRTVLLPYIYRPIAYETYFFSQFGTGEFVPTQANLQIYGNLAIADGFSANYAAFYGNSETTMLNTNANFWGPGQDPTPYKLVGGRLGFEYGDLQLGGSITYDRKDMNEISNGWSMVEVGIGSVPRTRLGAYLNYAVAGFELEAELIKVTYDFTQGNKDTLASKAMMGVPQKFEKTYYHANLLYNITDELAAYAGYDYLEGEDNIFISRGLGISTFGAAYRLNNSVILKVQYDHHDANMAGTMLTRNDYLIGASVSF